jgi:hypothetical protein
MVRGTRARGTLIWGAIIANGEDHYSGDRNGRIYQWVVLKTFYPREAVAIAVLLAFVPYLLLRGIVERVTRRWNA